MAGLVTTSHNVVILKPSWAGFRRSVFPLTPIIFSKRSKGLRLTPSPLILAPAGISSVFVNQGGANMKARLGELLVLIVGMGISLFPSGAVAGTSGASRKALSQLLLGKEVKPVLQLPATKEGINVYYSHKGNRIDERGLDLEDMTKWLKEKGVGVEANQPVPITEVRIGGDKVEVHLAGGGQGRRGSKHANQ